MCRDVNALEIHLDHQTRCELFAECYVALGALGRNRRPVALVLEQVVMVWSRRMVVVAVTVGGGHGRDCGSIIQIGERQEFLRAGRGGWS